MLPILSQSLPALLLNQAEKCAERLGLVLNDIDPIQQAVLAISDFVSDNAVQQPAWWQQLQQAPPEPHEWQHYTLWLQTQLRFVSDDMTLMRELRLFRRHMLMRIAWMQILASSSTEQSLQQLSKLAETLIISARDWLYQACCRDFGTPYNAQGEAQPLMILGMGKLGGSELNFSSDIDLIFCYPENGNTHGGRRELDNGQFFTRLGQRLIKALDQPTADGIVYRVDMRLRPFGSSGPLVLSFAALEDYYQEQGRDWERYAMIKGRLLGNANDHWSKELYRLLNPFVFRRYIDFGVIQSLREMKNLIAREVRRRDLSDNIKLGAGGIRESEFIVQVFQLIRGGRDRSLQVRSWLSALHALGELQLLTASQLQRLHSGYLFLRRLENLLQSIADQQTQTLPTDALNQTRLTWAMGFSNGSMLQAEVHRHRAIIREIFTALIGDDPSDINTQQKAMDYSVLWQETPNEQEMMLLTPLLDDIGKHCLLRELNEFRFEINKRTIGPRGRQALDKLMPHLLSELCRLADAAITLSRLTPLLLAIVTRSTYLELLTEYHGALKHLICLCSASPWVASQLVRYPLLLDELLDATTLYHPIVSNSYCDELHQYLLRIPEGDEEQQLEVLCQFKQVQHLRIAAADITATLPTMKVSDHLTWLAEALIESVVQQAWNKMVQRYGKPMHLGCENQRGFAVVGYGKLGGWELGYGSDLDVVFLHDCPADVMTDGEQCIDGWQFYLRLAQRVLHLFSARTSSGILYDVDARLRPSGTASMLISTCDAFSDYQHKEAWTWEHQALVRARVVYGGTELSDRFNSLRRAVLCQRRETVQLKNEVRSMREKMQAHYNNKHKGRWNIKADRGGIIDIEFITQYLVLRYAHQHPVITRWSDNVRILELLANQRIIKDDDAQTLVRAYVTLRDELHRRTLQALPEHIDDEALLEPRQRVTTIWQRFFAS